MIETITNILGTPPEGYEVIGYIVNAVFAIYLCGYIARLLFVWVNKFF